MRRAGAFSLVVALLSVFSVTAVEAQSIGLGRRLGDPTEASETEPPDEREPPPEEGSSWVGPQVGLHYSYLRLADGWGGGDTQAGGMTGFVQWPVSELRTGLLFEMGSRDNARSADDLVMRGALEIGFQLTELADPVVPHISAVVTVGGVVGERFETTVAHAFGGGGVEAGVSLRVFGTLHLDATFGYLRMEMNGAAYDTFLFRATLGL
ncbi:MAG: hypothetical protein AB8I08_13670 [Sandaracinaceae bacterium]